MVKRKIISIDEKLCNGCGNCVSDCAEGALEIVDGKARLVKEQFCDGFGDCIGKCPTGALKIEERDSDVFDIEATKQHVMQSIGKEGVDKMMNANVRHEKNHAVGHSGCPGSMARAGLKETGSKSAVKTSGLPARVNESELDQWPVQIHLVRPGAPFFKNRELVILSTCSPIASADVHWRFIRGRAVLVGCPKLDRTEGYAEKLGEILKEPSIAKVIVVRMEVPCCGGLTEIVERALDLSGRTDLEMEEVTISLNGEVMERGGF